MIKLLEIIEEKNRTQSISLYNYFLENYSTAPGSSNNHQNWEGGYFDHIEETLRYAGKLFSIIRDKPIDFTLSDAFLVLFLHDIEKPIKYSKNNVYFNDDSIREKLIIEFKFNLSNAQKLALKYIHGEGNDYKKDKRTMNQLGAFCHCCDVISSRIFYDSPSTDDRFLFKREHVIERIFDKKQGVGYLPLTDEELQDLKSGKKYIICGAGGCKNKTIEKYSFNYCSFDCSN